MNLAESLRKKCVYGDKCQGVCSEKCDRFKPKERMVSNNNQK